MVREFSNQAYWALILGGSSGLGLASAKKLANHGMNICIIHQNTRMELESIQESFQEIEDLGVEILTFNCDLVNTSKRNLIISDLLNTLAGTGKIRCLLHSISKGNLKAMVPVNQAPENIQNFQDNQIALNNQDFLFTIENMAVSLYSWTKDLHSAGLFASDARIISFTSEGSKRAWKHYAAVSAAKASLEAITRSIALEFAPYGLRANCIQAGITDTKSLRKIPGNEILKKSSIARNPFGRMTLPEDVANVVYLLCKDESSWINGAIIPVDGGEHFA